jgi:hypothetical protein
MLLIRLEIGKRVSFSSIYKHLLFYIPALGSGHKLIFDSSQNHVVVAHLGRLAGNFIRSSISVTR